MKKSSLSLIAGFFVGMIGASNAQAAVTVQDPGNVVGTGATAWSYLVLEGEDYASETDATPGVGFTRVDASGALTNLVGSTILSRDTTASKKGALFVHSAAKHGDKVTYQVQFAKPGTYYLYMRFTMFESTDNQTYLNEDSFFVPPDFGKDPQTDWPLMDGGGQNGGYTEGCCDGGYLTIKEAGTPVNHSAGDEEGRAFWEGNFHWNELSSSQFLNTETQGEPRVRRKYEVTADQVGKPLTWTISNRESGTTIDLWLFSTNPDLMDQYTQTQLDELLLKPTGKVTVQDPGNVVGTGATAWSYLVLEGEDYASETDATPGVGFTTVDASGALTNLVGSTILSRNTTASKKGALFVHSAAKHGDKVTYQVQFAKPGTYYLYMRFTMFESTDNQTYLNEDSFFVPPDFGKDPQTDWPLMDGGGQNGGYTEGCCDAAGYLFIPEKGGGGVRVSHAAGDEAGRAFWEGNFHWNDLISSQFLNTETQGEPRVRRKYEVTANQVGKPLTWTVSNREVSGTTIDLWLFSTNPDLMDQYTQEELDQLLLKPAGKVTVQDPGNVVGTGATAWSYLVLEGEDYASETDATPGVGFTTVDASGALTNLVGSTILSRNTTASKKGALFVHSAAKHGDKVTYQVQFAKPGTYYLYMRFTMFESTDNQTYLNEDSFFVPPDFGKDPQTDWPLMDGGGQNGGYTEGCCDAAGYLFIPEKGGGGVRVSHAAGDEAGRAFWEGNFHWNDLISSQFLNTETQGEPRVRRKYEVTANQVGKPLTWTVSNREVSGTTIDLWLFSTNPDLMDQYTQEELDQLLINPRPNLTVSHAGNNAVISWPTSAVGFVLESASALAPAAWTLVTTPAVVVVGDKNSVTVDATSGTRFYRLRKP